MFKNKLSLQTFAATISRSITNANDMLQFEHKLAVKRVMDDELGVLMPPPQPLMIQNVKVKFKANVSREDLDRDRCDLLIDLGKSDGNFSGELEFVPFSPEMMRSARSTGQGGAPFPARPARPSMMPPPPPPVHQAPPPPMAQPSPSQEAQPFMMQDDAPPAYPGETNSQAAYDSSDTPRNYSIDV